MRKLLVFLLLISSVSSYGQQLSKNIENLMPIERARLALSMKEVGDAYEQAGDTKKANAYYQVALKTYPIGDTAHALAIKLNQKLDDQQVYGFYLNKGKELLLSNQPQQALNAFSMASEVQTTFELYRELARTYNALGDTQKANQFAILTQGLYQE